MSHPQRYSRCLHHAMEESIALDLRSYFHRLLVIFPQNTPTRPGSGIDLFKLLHGILMSLLSLYISMHRFHHRHLRWHIILQIIIKHQLLPSCLTPRDSRIDSRVFHWSRRHHMFLLNSLLSLMLAGCMLAEASVHFLITNTGASHPSCPRLTRSPFPLLLAHEIP
ncbi:unnamed protein product [Linum trigynum]|uniref:Uncharacterized protein n=1 Tax=Linum trigynum TaxID=586398 RepID=A0AAV2GKV0_9ROSI